MLLYLEKWLSARNTSTRLDLPSRLRNRCRRECHFLGKDTLGKPKKECMMGTVCGIHTAACCPSFHLYHRGSVVELYHGSYKVVHSTFVRDEDLSSWQVTPTHQGEPKSWEDCSFILPQ